jgi:hypothetical protein
MINPTVNDIGRGVKYFDGGWRTEYGVITSFNEKVVFVRFVGDFHSKGCRREDLEYEH